MVAQDPTKARLLEGAGEEFAEKGFELARVRAICDRAGANLAAINYHFGDKEHLYVEVLREAHRCGLDPQEKRFDPGLSPAERLRAFIHHFLDRVLAMTYAFLAHLGKLESLAELLKPHEDKRKKGR